MTTMRPRPARATRRFDSIQQEAFLGLWRTYDRLRMLEEELFGHYGLTPQQYNALRLLRREHPRKLATLDLAARLVSRAPDITRMLDRLQERGLIERHRPADNRRMVQVGITPRGLALLTQLRQGVRDCHEQQMGHLSDGQIKQLIRLLRAARRPHEDPTSNWL